MKKGRKIQWLALSFLVTLLFNACSVEDAPTLSLKDILVGKKWRVDTYLVDPLAGWKDQDIARGFAEIEVTSNLIIITQHSRYNDVEPYVCELAIASFEQDTLRTGEWMKESWHALEANKKIFRRDNTDNDGSIWIQSGDYQLILESIKE